MKRLRKDIYQCDDNQQSAYFIEHKIQTRCLIIIFRYSNVIFGLAASRGAPCVDNSGEKQEPSCVLPVLGFVLH